MLKIYPVGARVWVKDVLPVNEIVARAKQAGLSVVTLETNEPRPTSGIVVARGNDPIVLEMIDIGDIVFFSRYAGHMINIEGKEYHSLEVREITAVMRQDSSTSSSALPSS